MVKNEKINIRTKTYTQAVSCPLKPNATFAARLTTNPIEKKLRVTTVTTNRVRRATKECCSNRFTSHTASIAAKRGPWIS